MKTMLLAALFALTLTPACLATGGVYAGDGFYAAGADPCEANGSTTISVGQPTTGIADGYWFDEYVYTCANGSTVTVRIKRGPAPPPPVEEESGYEPDSPPSAPCVEARYTDNGWDEGTC